MSKFILKDFISKIVEAHNSTNHYYDDYLPYEFHLRMAITFGKKHIHLIEESRHPIVFGAIIAHDAVEDARLSYNDIKKIAISCGATDSEATDIAEMARAVTNYGRGRNRDERMPDYIYEEIRTILESLFVKLCDRLANVTYGVMTGSTKPTMYKKEHGLFKSKLYDEGRYEEMWLDIDDIFSKI